MSCIREEELNEQRKEGQKDRKDEGWKRGGHGVGFGLSDVNGIRRGRERISRLVNA